MVDRRRNGDGHGARTMGAGVHQQQQPSARARGRSGQAGAEEVVAYQDGQEETQGRHRR